MSLQNRSNFWKGLRGRKNHIWRGPDPQNRALAYTRAQFSQNHVIPQKYRTVTKIGPKSDPQREGKIDLVTSFASELVVWRRQLAQICALAGTRCKNEAKQASRRPTNWSKTRKRTEKRAWKVPRRDSALKKTHELCARQQKYKGTS